MTPAMIEIIDLHKSYHNGATPVQALRGITLSIRPSDFLALAGPSGSGKTTLLNIIGCIDQADRGELTLAGIPIPSRSARPESRRQAREITRQQVAVRRKKIGFIFQNFNLIPVLTAQENVAIALTLLDLSPEEVFHRSREILGEVGLEGLEDRRPGELSGGQQQRVAVARALVKNPLIVVADEPTANLDSETGTSILNLMREIHQRRGTTFVFSTHDPRVMDRASRLCLLRDGTLQEEQERVLL
ncbi:ABC transporter [Alkalispirochaeta sphaeroplastigenens]|uniref:ABC transporter n=1 Tax=Alkalispirochaeta sphaeroplastigenens TaxID=1187066 RepID=A0A2S4JJH3_9SPIO|nr:ABC transporter ATP-binding protein [Alkalispirochaeta sphaeroplastigenens]POQ99687.1 ABC transporter [Alkalispirochaeta sphaeroplastigenens]